MNNDNNPFAVDRQVVPIMYPVFPYGTRKLEGGRGEITRETLLPLVIASSVPRKGQEKGGFLLRFRDSKKIFESCYFKPADEKAKRVT